MLCEDLVAFDDHKTFPVGSFLGMYRCNVVGNGTGLILLSIRCSVVSLLTAGPDIVEV